MMMSNSDTISTLNNLIETCRDGQEGFKDAAESVDNSALKSLFYDYSQQRAGFVGALQGEVRRLGGDPGDTGSMAAALHRGWINIKSAVAGNDEAAVINECERGEDSAVEQYEEALNTMLPAPTRDLVASQYTQVKAAHDRISDMKHHQQTKTAW